MGAKRFGYIHGHGGMDTQFASRITTVRDFAAVTTITNEHLVADLFGIDEEFSGYKESIEIEEGDMAGGGYLIKNTKQFSFLICFFFL